MTILSKITPMKTIMNNKKIEKAPPGFSARWHRVRSELGLVGSEDLRPEVKNRLAHLMEQDLNYVSWKCVSEASLSAGDVQIAEKEFKRFMALVIIGYSPLAMFGKVVDEFWHQFVLFTREYKTFCAKVVGYFVHHQPDTPVSRVPEGSGKVFVEAYRKHFGELPVVWFRQLPAAVREFYSRAELNGKVPWPANVPRWSAWVAKSASIKRPRNSPLRIRRSKKSAAR